MSPDGNILAYSGTSRATSDTPCSSGLTHRTSSIPTGFRASRSGVTWAADSGCVYYTTVDDAWRPDTVWRHRLGSQAPAEQVFIEPDERFWVAVGRTRSNAYRHRGGFVDHLEVRLADASDPDAEFHVVLRREGVEYSVEHAVVVGGRDRF